MCADKPTNRSTQVEQFKHELRQGGRIDMGNLRAFAFHGIPDGGGLRSTAWKVLVLTW